MPVVNCRATPLASWRVIGSFANSRRRPSGSSGWRVREPTKDRHVSVLWVGGWGGQGFMPGVIQRRSALDVESPFLASEKAECRRCQNSTQHSRLIAYTGTGTFQACHFQDSENVAGCEYQATSVVHSSPTATILSARNIFDQDALRQCTPSHPRGMPCTVSISPSHQLHPNQKLQKQQSFALAQ